MFRHVVFVAALCVAASPAVAAPPADFDQRVESLRKEVGVPGMAIAIVEDGEVTLAEGYGVKELAANDPVDADTIFPTGSTGKAFTVTALATLVDAGKIAWDDKVTDHLPWFQMYDPWVTREMTVRDLLVHWSGLGLGAGDLLFVPSAKFSRRESVRRLRYIEPETSFRSGYAYDNVLYMVAGQLIEAVSGQTWEDYVVEHVLRPAGMVNSTSDDDARFATPNRAQPHGRVNGAFRGLGEQVVLGERKVELGRNNAPAGGLASSANDMARWLLIQLAHGKLPESEGRLFSEASAKKMWTPVVILPDSELPPSLDDAEPDFSAYALGWGVSDYKGAKIVSHGGFVWGFKTLVLLIPERDVGFAIMINSEDGELIRGLQYALLDHYLGEPKRDWPADWIAYKETLLAEAKKQLAAERAEPADVGPSLPLSGYTGTYADPWYGSIVIAEKDGKLSIDFGVRGMAGTLRHWQYDTFETVFDDPAIEPAYVTFALDAEGKVDRITMNVVSPAADFSYDYRDLLFTPVGAGQ